MGDKKMKQPEGKRQKFKVEIDDHDDFKIVSKSPNAHVTTTTVVVTKQTLQGERSTKTKKTSTTEGSKKLPIRSKPFIPTGLSKEKVKKIKQSIASQRIADYVRTVSPDDGIVDEVAFLGHIKWQMYKKFPERYLDMIKEKGIMVPCGKGKLRFTEKF